MTNTNKLPQPLDITGGVPPPITIWQKYCGHCGWVILKEQNCNLCPECGWDDIHEREIVK